MKVNLIYDMRHQDESWFDKFSKDDRGKAVLAVLNSSRHATEFAKIIDGLETIEANTLRDFVYIRRLLIGSQISEFERLKIKYNYIG